MSFFIDRFNRRKSPIALAAFGAAVLYLVIFGVLYGLLAGPLYRAVSLSTPAATTAVHSLIIAAIGTAVCCLLFLLKDKRVAPYGFCGLAVALCMFYAAAFLLDGLARSNMLYLITAYGLAPVLVELKDAVAKEAAKKPVPPEQTQPSKPVSSDRPEPSGDALFGPQADRSPMVSRSVQEEAMLFYEDDDDEETGND